MVSSTDNTDDRKYAPLGRYLRALPDSQPSVTLSFAEIESIIGASLPRSAFDYHHQWWANQTDGSRAPHWSAAGFKVDGVHVGKRQVRFARKDTKVAQKLRPLTLLEIVNELNRASRGRPIGTLPQWRSQRYGLSRVPVNTLFYSKLKQGREWAFHVGGLSELQFNVGFEEFHGTRIFRHGVAFSLQTTREMPDIEPLVPRIARFNEFFRIHPNYFEGFSMWHWDGERSDSYPVMPIPPAYVRPGVFIFIGATQPAATIDVDWILDDFDRLLPLYQYVEGTDSFPRLERECSGFHWSPGNKARTVRARYERRALTVDRSLRHNVVQDALFRHLSKIHGEQNTSGEQGTGNGTRIDVATRKGRSHTYYELKMGLSAQSCIREAIGQLLEYSFWPGSQAAESLVVVGEWPYDKHAKAYLEELRKRFSLPIKYQQFDLKSGRLI